MLTRQIVRLFSTISASSAGRKTPKISSVIVQSVLQSGNANTLVDTLAQQSDPVTSSNYTLTQLLHIAANQFHIDALPSTAPDHVDPLASALQVYNFMLSNNISIDIRSATSMMNLFRGRLLFRRMKSLYTGLISGQIPLQVDGPFKRTQGFSREFFLVLIRGLFTANDLNFIPKVLGDMQARGIPVDYLINLILLKGYALVKDTVSAEKHLNQALDDVPQFNYGQFHIFLYSLLRLGKYELFMEYKQKMNQLGFKDSAYAWNMLIRYYGRIGDHDKMLETFENPPASGTADVNWAPYITMICSFQKTGEFARAKDIYNRLLKSGIQPSRYALSYLVNFFCSIGDIHSALEISKLCRREFPRAFAFIIRHMMKANQKTQALELLQEMRRVCGNCVEGLKFIVEHDISYYQDLIRETQESGRYLTVQDWDNIMRRHPDPWQVYRDIQAAGNLILMSGTRPDTRLLNSFIVRLLQRGEDVKPVIEEMKRYELRPDLFTFGLSIQASDQSVLDPDFLDTLGREDLDLEASATEPFYPTKGALDDFEPL